MNREFKFRCWEFSVKRFHYLNFDTGMLGCFVGSSYISNRNQYQQYIGLKDINGKEIYEGDILKNQFGKIGLVTYVAPEFRFIYPKTSETGGVSQTIYYCDSYEILGNIFENPELFK